MTTRRYMPSESWCVPRTGGSPQAVDVADTHHTRGRIGLNVFGGRAACQDTFVTAQ
ncbi:MULTISPECIES: hypothetical protein [unclassified Streptomyces]|uniref:hypothetical protein n=1 Tax=unclassified Streptomyces TaxID=2593676 RepID=UPI002E75ED57|nr:hypothetical protein [Streptomyces sp. JV184]MEE1747617.1 hypothetical protein [Streptomyces sp. JV184]